MNSPITPHVTDKRKQTKDDPKTPINRKRKKSESSSDENWQRPTNAQNNQKLFLTTLFLILLGTDKLEISFSIIRCISHAYSKGFRKA